MKIKHRGILMNSLMRFPETTRSIFLPIDALFVFRNEKNNRYTESSENIPNVLYTVEKLLFRREG